MKRWLRGALIGLGAFVIAGVLWLSGITNSFEWSTYDARARSLAKPGANTPRVITILLDQESLDWGEETMLLPFPWPREVLTYMISFVARGNPKALAFDVIYTEPSDFGDDVFAASIADFGDFVTAVHLLEDEGNVAAPPWPTEGPRSVEVSGLEEWLQTRWGRHITYPDVSFPIPPVAAAAEFFGNVSAKPDADGVYRAVPLLGVYDGNVIPTLALATFMAGSDAEVPIRAERNKLRIGENTIHLDPLGRAIPRFRGPTQTHMAVKAAAVLRSEILILEGSEPEIDPSVFEDAYVLFGYSAPSLKDLRPAPVDERYPGVEIHASVLDNILTNDFIRPLNTGVTLLLAFSLTIAAGMAVTLTRKIGWQATTFVVFLLLPIGLAYAGYAAGFWVPLVVAEMGVLFSLIGGTAANYFTEGKQRRFLKTAFQFYLSPEVIEDIIVNPEQLALGGHRQELTIFFSDLQGFTTITESLQERTPALINEYLTPMANIIFDENGTIDKYEGDAIIAFWNAPKKYEDHAQRCVRTALRCQEKLSELRDDFVKRYGHELHMRIGMNTGYALVGNMGSQTRFDYTMLGDAVNLAARLEGANKLFGTYTMISEYTKQAIGDTFPTRELGRIIVKGKTKPVTVFEPFLPEAYAARRDTLTEFERGLQLFYNEDITSAVGIFADLSDVDPAAKSYHSVFRDVTDPGPDWNGVIELTEK